MKNEFKSEAPQTRDFKRRVRGAILGVRVLLWPRFGDRFWEFGACFGEGLGIDFGSSGLALAKVRGSILGVRSLQRGFSAFASNVLKFDLGS